MINFIPRYKVSFKAVVLLLLLFILISLEAFAVSSSLLPKPVKPQSWISWFISFIKVPLGLALAASVIAVGINGKKSLKYLVICLIVVFIFGLLQIFLPSM